MSISSSSDIESLESISLDNESFISFKTKSNSTVDLSIKSLTKSLAKISIASMWQKRKNFIDSIKNKTKTLPSKFKEDFKNLISKQKEKKIERDFLGYYECLIPGIEELSIPKIYLSTARIDLHEEKTENSEEAKRFVLTRIKGSPYNKNNQTISLFIITGKGKQRNTGMWTGKKFNGLPKWMQDDSVKHLINGVPAKGLGAYKVFIKKIKNEDIFQSIELNELEEKAKNEDGFKYKMMLAGFYLICIKSIESNPGESSAPDAEIWYEKAIQYYQEAESLGSIEAKLCLGYMYSIGFKINYYDPRKAKKLFKEVIDANKETSETTETTTGNKDNTDKHVTEKMTGKSSSGETTTDKEANVEEEIADKEAIGEATADKETDKELTEGATENKEQKGTAANKEITEETASEELAKIAMRNIAIMYHNSYIIKPLEWKNVLKVSKPKDLTVKNLSQVKLKLAIKWYKRACKLGDTQSAYHLGMLYENNNDIMDKNEAEYWYEKAVQFDNNNLYAKAKLGRILINKEGANESEKTNGIQMLKDAAEWGLVMGQTFLGEAYERGQIVTNGGEKAASKFYFEAAKQNYGFYSHFAQYRLKELYALYDSNLIPEDCDIKVNEISDIIKLYVKELEYYYNKEEKIFEDINIYTNE